MTFKFTGSKADATIAASHDMTCASVDKGIALMAGGKLRLFGKRGVAPDDGRSAQSGGPNPGSVSWTYLAKPAGPVKYQTSTAKIGSPVAVGGETTLYVAADVSKDWLAEDWIVVGTTSFSPFESEFVKIDRVDLAGGLTKITLNAKTPLRHYHFGSPDPLRPSTSPLNASADATTNYGVDERAEVGLISRNIVLTAEMPPYTTTNELEVKSLAWGGETKFCAGFTEAKLQGVEIEKFGKDQLGSYPIHLHMAGTVPAGAALFNSNSIHHSYSHCATIHLTNDVTFSNNVCARVIGHIFYQEKPKDPSPKPLSYDNVQNTGIRFHDNLGLGAMANGFGIGPEITQVKQPDDKLAYEGFWEGDYLARSGDGYYGLFVPDTDDGTLAVTGSCFTVQNPAGKGIDDGKLVGGVPPSPEGKCAGSSQYFEPPSGFWIVNPGTEMIGNSIGGCQSIGKAFWFVVQRPYNADDKQLEYQKLGTFRNNRAHACFDGIWGENDTGVVQEQLFPKVGGVRTGKNLIARFDAFTATRIRNRAMWLRPAWNVFENVRIATSREGVSLVSSGGLEGNAPGVWGLLRNATIVGVSMNNVDRWGPCPNRAPAYTNAVRESPGCVDWNSQSHTIYDKGYPTPAWNFAGIYIYDGPARLHEVRFVNFHVDPSKNLLTSEDGTFQKDFGGYRDQNLKVYEGDAALGWFANNQSAYPVATEARGLRFESVDLRHQVFTDKVNFGRFDDGDKNTAIIDRDGTLTGFKIAGAVHDAYPISLNNLPFNSASNAVDECLAEGAQDTKAEGRPTSLISPAYYGTLEFEAFTLPDGVVPPVGPRDLTQLVTFAKDTIDYERHSTMTLHSRDNQGIWEPKVVGGLGYTVTAQNATGFANARAPGFPRRISVGINDVVKPGISSADPFYARVGVCYTNKDGTHPDGKFTIRRGYRSWGSGPVYGEDPDLRKKYIKLDHQYKNKDGVIEFCFNLAAQIPSILNDSIAGCPAHGIYVRGDTERCPAPAFQDKDLLNLPVCAFAPTTLTQALGYRELTNEDGTPKNLDKWFYDKSTGMLFFYVKQDRPNAEGGTPLGSCPGDSACPDPSSRSYRENYYACPPEGCATYTVQLDPSTPYDPGESACNLNNVKGDPQLIYKDKPEYAQKAPTAVNQLAFVVPVGTSPAPPFKDGDIVAASDNVTRPDFPHRTAEFRGVAANPICVGAPPALAP